MQLDKKHYSLCRIMTSRGTKIHNAYFELDEGWSTTYCGIDGNLNYDFEQVHSAATCEYCSNHDEKYELAEEGED